MMILGVPLLLLLNERIWSLNIRLLESLDYSRVYMLYLPVSLTLDIALFTFFFFLAPLIHAFHCCPRRGGRRRGLIDLSHSHCSLCSLRYSRIVLLILNVSILCSTILMWFLLHYLSNETLLFHLKDIYYGVMYIPLSLVPLFSIAIETLIKKYHNCPLKTSKTSNVQRIEEVEELVLQQ